MKKLCRTILLLAIATALCAASAATASAATYNVNTTADPVGAGCAGGTCSLRQAIEVINAGPGTGDTINVPAGDYQLVINDLRVNNPTAIVGAGARSTILRAAPTKAVIYFETGSPSSLSGVTITGGSDAGPAGLENDVVLTISQTTIAGNHSSGTAGGVYNSNSGTLTIESSTISGNTAATSGGGIYSTGPLTLNNSTVSGNTATTSTGGGAYLDDSISITNSTIAGNSATGGGGVEVGSSTTTFKNTIVAGNTATTPGQSNCSGATLASLGGNLEDADSCNFSLGSDRRNTPSGLAVLADYGGPTDTRALISGSAAVDLGSGCPATDQRGVSRQGGCDAGAYELAPPGVTTGSTSGRTVSGATVSGTVTPNLRATTYHFDYGKTTAYGSATTVSDAGSGTSPVAVGAVLAGLEANTKYHYRLVASSGDGTTIGSDRTFTTSRFTGATLALRTLPVDKRRRVVLRIKCPALTAGGTCRSRASLFTAKGKLPKTARARKARRLAVGSFGVSSGKTQTKLIKLNRTGKRFAKPHRTFRARLMITSRGSSGNTVTKTYRVKVRRR